MAKYDIHQYYLKNTHQFLPKVILSLLFLLSDLVACSLCIPLMLINENEKWDQTATAAIHHLPNSIFLCVNNYILKVTK